MSGNPLPFHGLTRSDIKNSLSQYTTLLARNPNVRFLWFSQIASLFGDWFNFIGATELITHLAPSSISISILIGVRTVAPVLGAPLVPLVVRLMRRRTILIVSDLVRCSLVLGLLLVRTADDLWLLYALIGLQGLLSGLFFPIRTAILPRMVANEEELGAANTLGSLSWTAMIAIGTALGGVVTEAWGITAAFLIDAATFLLSAGLLLQIRYQPPVPGKREQKPAHAIHHLHAEAGATYADLFRMFQMRRDLLWLSLKKTAISVFSFIPTQVLQIMLSREYPQIGSGPIVLGVIFAVGGAVSFFSPILVRVITGNDHRLIRQAILMSYLVIMVGMIMQAPVPPFGVLLLGVALRSVGAVLIWTFSTQLILSLTPPHMLDHLLSFEYFVLNLMGVLGVILPASMVDNPRLGIFGAFTALSVSFLLLALLWGTWLWKGIYTVPTRTEPAT